MDGSIVARQALQSRDCGLLLRGSEVPKSGSATGHRLGASPLLLQIDWLRIGHANTLAWTMRRMARAALDAARPRDVLMPKPCSTVG